MRIDPEEYKNLPIKAHTLLAEVPIHDVWAVDLPGGPRQATVSDVMAALDLKHLRAVNSAVKFLFGLRARVGSALGWDRDRGRITDDSFIHRLSDEDRQASLIPPGTPDGARFTLFVSEHESISELRNATVHAFSVLVLTRHPRGYRLYWAIYVMPVGRITKLYMGLIDPFRRFIIYPAVLREIPRAWSRSMGLAPGIG